jgi:hypothetical protein
VSELHNLLQRLSDAGIEFVVVGGVAAVLHGSSLVTRDLDVCAELSSQNLRKLRDALRDLHPVHRIGPPRLSFLDVPEPGASLVSIAAGPVLHGHRRIWVVRQEACRLKTLQRAVWNRQPRPSRSPGAAILQPGMR